MNRFPFSTWASGYGPRRIAQSLGVDRSSVYRWISIGHVPRADFAVQIVTMSEGRLTLGDVVRVPHYIRDRIALHGSTR